MLAHPLGEGVHHGVVVVLDGYPVEVLLGLTVEVHVPDLKGRVVSVVVAADREVPVRVGRSGYELVRLGRVHLGHLLPAGDEDEVVVSRFDEEVGVYDGVYRG